LFAVKEGVRVFFILFEVFIQEINFIELFFMDEISGLELGLGFFVDLEFVDELICAPFE
jgi:hypothetical protein